MLSAQATGLPPSGLRGTRGDERDPHAALERRIGIGHDQRPVVRDGGPRIDQ
jgi:hypothetical protein